MLRGASWVEWPQVARNLVNLYNQVAAGDYSYVEALRQLPNADTAAACQRDPVSFLVFPTGSWVGCSVQPPSVYGKVLLVVLSSSARLQ